MKKIEKHTLNKYIFNIYTDKKTIEFDFQYFTQLTFEEVIQNEIIDGFLKVDDWLININEIQSINLYKTEKVNIYCQYKDIQYIEYFDLARINELNKKYNDFLNSYNNLFKK